MIFNRPSFSRELLLAAVALALGFVARAGPAVFAARAVASA